MICNECNIEDLWAGDVCVSCGVCGWCGCPPWCEDWDEDEDDDGPSAGNRF